MESVGLCCASRHVALELDLQKKSSTVSQVWLTTQPLSPSPHGVSNCRTVPKRLVVDSGSPVT